LNTNFVYNKIFQLQLIALLIGASCSAQTFTNHAFNTAGNQISIGKNNYEWSVGESSAITTMLNDRLMLTNGLLQYSVQNQPQITTVPSFLPNEVKVGPNPITTVVEVNILHAEKGKHSVELLDNKGNKIKGVQINYSGMGAYQKWDIDGLPAGQYFINIQQMHPVNGKLVKHGAYQIVKSN
jgi:hypothetical protein